MYQREWRRFKCTSGLSPRIPRTVTDTSEHIRFYILVLLFSTFFSFWFRAVDYDSFRVDVQVASRIVSYRIGSQATHKDTITTQLRDCTAHCISGSIIACCASSRRIAFEKSHRKQVEQNDYAHQNNHCTVDQLILLGDIRAKKNLRRRHVPRRRRRASRQVW